jgi:pimeloyl-ACP methyl ester carboxylesterase
MSNWSSGFVEVDGARLHYHRTGGGKPAIVMAHGLTDNGLCWTRVARDLEPEYDVVMYDARGHGQSTAASADDARDVPATDLVRLTGVLGIDRPSLLGHSMGAVTVALAAALEPSAFRCAVLVDPPLRMDQGAGRLEDAAPPVGNEWWEQWRQAVVEERSLPQATLLAACQARCPGWAAIEQECWVRAHREVDPTVFDVRYPMHGPWQREAARMRCPVLFITGDPQLGALADRVAAEELVRRVERGRLVRISGAGHSVHRDRYDDFMHRVHAFLALASAEGS